tara:strand:- start:12 stop:218 length:207 start_codon:yes stop_codon:yes gene_type:complete
MILIQYRELSALNHVKNLDADSMTSWWTCMPTSFGRCGIQNSCGRDIKKYIMRLHGNLALRSGGGYEL